MNPIARSADISVFLKDERLVIQDFLTSSQYTLNEFERCIWELLDGKNSVDKITEFLSQKTRTDIKREDVWKVLDKLADLNLLEKRLNPPGSQLSEEQSFSRRKFNAQLIRRFSVGTAGAVLGASIPTIALAQSSQSEQVAKEQQFKANTEQQFKANQEQQSKEQSSKEQNSKEQQSKVGEPQEQQSKEQQSKTNQEQRSKEQESKANQEQQSKTNQEQQSKEQQSKADQEQSSKEEQSKGGNSQEQNSKEQQSKANQEQHSKEQSSKEQNSKGGDSQEQSSKEQRTKNPPESIPTPTLLGPAAGFLGMKIWKKRQEMFGNDKSPDEDS